MDTNTFNKDLDKVTERETVFDFYERLPIGKNLYLDSVRNAESNNGTIQLFEDNRLIFENNSLMQTIIKKIMYSLPGFAIDNLADIKSYNIIVPKGRTGTFSVNVPGQLGNILMAISNCTGIDVSSEITRSMDSENSQTGTMNRTIFSYTVNYPYDNDDIITVYVLQ